MISYLAETSLLLSVFYAFYMLVMRKTTFFRLNRMAILAGSAACLLLPLAEFEGRVAEYVADLPHIVLPEVIQDGTVTEARSGLSWHRILEYAYMTGCASVLACTCISIVKTLGSCRKYAAQREGQYFVHIIPDGRSAFSVFRHIFISSEDYADNPAILAHEKMHARFHHSADLLLMDMLAAFQWFNPLVWLMRSELKMLHEYQADEAVINQGIDAKQYQLLLVRKAVGTERFLIANNFRHSSLKNRITMMIRKKTDKWKRLAYLACLPLLFTTLCLCSGKDVKAAPAASEEFRPELTTQGMTDTATALDGDKKTALNPDAVETPPKFNGEGIDGFTRWLKDNLKYPESAKQGGRALVQFTVSETGKVCNVKMVRGIAPDIDKATLEAISASPDWTPALVVVDGKPAAVAVNYMIPILIQVSE